MVEWERSQKEIEIHAEPDFTPTLYRRSANGLTDVPVDRSNGIDPKEQTEKQIGARKPNSTVRSAQPYYIPSHSMRSVAGDIADCWLFLLMVFYAC